MIVLETQEISPDGNNTRYVTAVTQTVIKAVDAQGYPYYYSRDNGKLRCSAQSSRIMEDRTLFGGLRPYLNADNTINPQWKRTDGASVQIKAIKGIRIKRLNKKM